MKNVVIYSDGTGQRGGLLFDERRSNIYKLFRATRCGPDSPINPSEQLTFYDPGLGTIPPGHGFGVIETAIRWFYNLVSQATGLGITRNIIDCYAAIIRLWQPGDRIFLFGFSRGAYTVRCLSAVIGMCGVPTQDERGEPLRRDQGTTKRIAEQAVKKIYQHTESRKTFETDRQKELAMQRDELARRFRDEYQSADSNDATKANVYPYFIGVFDTVASLANPVAIVALSLVASPVLAIASFVLSFFVFGFWACLGLLLLAVTLIGFVLSLINRVRFEFKLPKISNWRPFHLTAPRMEFYDTDLNPNLSYARHALAIDERRKAFQRVGWGGSYSKEQEESGSFEQVWFAGDHSDIGGSYLENESRLSDISLKWMLDAAVTAGLKYDPSVLRLYPDPTGCQHDESRNSFLFRIASKLPRNIPNDAPLHGSVFERFAAAEVLDYDRMKPYRPVNLRDHDQVKHYYG